MPRRLVALAVLLLAPCAAALEPFTATYEVRHSGARVGEAVLTLSQSEQENEWALVSRTEIELAVKAKLSRSSRTHLRPQDGERDEYRYTCDKHAESDRTGSRQFRHWRSAVDSLHQRPHFAHASHGRGRQHAGHHRTRDATGQRVLACQPQARDARSRPQPILL